MNNFSSHVFDSQSVEIPTNSNLGVFLKAHATGFLSNNQIETLEIEMRNCYRKLEKRTQVAGNCVCNVLKQVDRSILPQIPAIPTLFNVEQCILKLLRSCLEDIQSGKTTNVSSWWKNLYLCRRKNETYLCYTIDIFRAIDQFLEEHIPVTSVRKNVFCKIASMLPYEMVQLGTKQNRWMTQKVEQLICPRLFGEFKDKYTINDATTVQEMFDVGLKFRDEEKSDPFAPTELNPMFDTMDTDHETQFREHDEFDKMYLPDVQDFSDTLRNEFSASLQSRKSEFFYRNQFLILRQNYAILKQENYELNLRIFQLEKLLNQKENQLYQNELQHQSAQDKLKETNLFLQQQLLSYQMGFESLVQVVDELKAVQPSTKDNTNTYFR